MEPGNLKKASRELLPPVHRFQGDLLRNFFSENVHQLGLVSDSSFVVGIPENPDATTRAGPSWSRPALWKDGNEPVKGTEGGGGGGGGWWFQNTRSGLVLGIARSTLGNKSQP